MKHKLFILLLVFFTCMQTRAQESDLQAAFSKSYIMEKNQLYGPAIDALKPFYTETNYALNIRMGFLNYEAGKNAEAIAFYEKAIKIRPTCIEARLGYILPATVLAKWEDIIRQYTEILSIEPRNSYVNYKLGYIYYYRKNYTEALKYFLISENLYPFDYGSVLMCGWSTYFLGKTDDARGLFERVLLINPYDKSALEGLAMISKK